MERPRICLIDVVGDICKEIEDAGFNCFIGTLGSIIVVPNKKPHDRHLCRLYYKFPPNIHEYDIVVIDLQNIKRKPFVDGRDKVSQKWSFKNEPPG